MAFLNTGSKQFLARCFLHSQKRSFGKVPPPKLFEFEFIKENLKPSIQINEAIEKAFGMLAKGEVDVPIPMHIGIHESPVRSDLFYLNGLIKSNKQF